MEPLEPDALASVLLQRRECLQALLEQPQKKRDLVETIDVPRSTLDDIVRELEDARLVEYADGVWQPTVLGRCVFHTHENYRDRLDSLSETTSVIDALPQDSPIGREFLEGADVVESNTAMPDGVIRVLVDSVESATRVRGFTPVVFEGYLKLFRERTTTGERCQLEFIFPSNAFERLRDTCSERIEAALRNEHISLYLGSISVSFGLWVADGNYASVIVYTDRGIRGIITNDTPEAIAWATDQYERIERDAESVFSARETTTSR